MVEHPRGSRKHTSPAVEDRPKQPAEKTEQLVFTLNPGTREVIKIERLGAHGTRQEISEQDRADLAGDESDDVLAAAQSAYEAGVADGLDEEPSEDVANEDLILLRLLVGQPSRHRRVQHELRLAMLRRLLLRRLLRRRIPPHVQPAAQQGRQPIANEAWNGSANHP